jgi:hypothetical protein
MLERRPRPLIQLCALAATLAAAACGDDPPSASNDAGSSFPADSGVENITNFGPEVESSPVPPPLSGGTLLLAAQGRIAVAADPDRDLIHIVELETETVRPAIVLDRGTEPGRAVEDAAGRVHVALRGSGELVTIDPTLASLIGRRPACIGPRGVAYENARDLIHVACVSGELVSFPASGGDATRRLYLGPDLRDIVFQGPRLWISRFRTATILELDESGTQLRELVLPDHFSSRTGRTYTPAIATRMIARPGGGAVLLHQRASIDPIQLEASPGQPSVNVGYTGISTCDSKAVHTVVTLIDASGAPDNPGPHDRLLTSTDIAVTPNNLAVVAVAAGFAQTSFQARVFFVASRMPDVDEPCAVGSVLPRIEGAGELFSEGELTSVAIAPDGTIIFQDREPAALRMVKEEDSEFSRVVLLGGASVAHLGHALFHRNAGGNIACASCHPEAMDDGHIWLFEGLGARRTQALRVGLLSTAPFHWDAEFPDIRALLADVFVTRMGGRTLNDQYAAALAQFLDAQRPFGGLRRDEAAIARGRDLFHDETVACSKCHDGERFTNNTSADVGTGGEYQVPSLLDIAYRAPFMHDGCAATLRQRFDPICGGEKHGETAALSEAELADLIAYLESL